MLKEEQQRTLQRQLQDLMLRQTVRQSGGTYHLERHRQSTSSSSTSGDTTPSSLGGDRGTLSVGLLADLQRREAQMRDRQQQTGDAHSQALSSQSKLPTLDSFLQAVITPIRRMIQPLPIPAREPETVDLSRDNEADAQEQYFPDIMTARSNPEELIATSLRYTNPDAIRGEIARATNVLIKYTNFKPEQIATNFNNFNVLDEIYGVLNRNGFISDDGMGASQALIQSISEEKNGRKRASLLRNLAKHKRSKVFDKSMNDIAERPVPA